MPNVRNRMQSMATEARHGLDDAITLASDQGRRAMHAAGDYGGAVQHTGEMMAEEAARRIRDYPVTTVLAAAALGLFSGFLLSRR